MSAGDEWANDPETERLRDALKRVKIEFDQVLPDVIRILAPVGAALKEASKEFMKLAFKAKHDGVSGPEDKHK